MHLTHFFDAYIKCNSDEMKNIFPFWCISNNFLGFLYRWLIYLTKAKSPAMKVFV